MTQYGLPFDGILTGDASVAPYSATEWARQWQLRHGVGSVFPNYGVFKGTGGTSYDPLSVQATNPVSANVEIQIGAALVNGRFYESTAAELLPVSANASGNPRIDTVILRIDYVAQTTRLVIKQGTPAASPVAPTLQQDATYWEMPLANIAVANGFSTLAQTTITDRRRSVQASPSGWQPYAYPLTYIVNGNYDAATTTFGLNQGVVVPVVIPANMLIESVTVRHIGANAGYILNWGLYYQDVNEGNTAENTLRLIARGSGTGGLVGTGNVTLTATPAPQPVSPGAYWLVFHNGSGNSFAMGSITLTGLESGLTAAKLTATGFSITQTLDLVTNWTSTLSRTLAVRINGRVFGQTTAF